MQLNIPIQLPTLHTKELSDQEKRWEIQREIETYLETEQDLKKFNWEKYVAFLKKYKINQWAIGQDNTIKRWKKEGGYGYNADIRRITPMNKKTLGYFTSHLDEQGLWYVLSECKLRKEQGLCVTNYIKSLVKYEK